MENHDVVLKTKGLDKRQIDNVMLIGPSEEIAAREKLEILKYFKSSKNTFISMFLGG